MSPTFNSGAFIQQCFAVHPLSLNFKALTLPDKNGVVICANCNMRHRFTMRELTTRVGEESLPEQKATEYLAHCVEAHPENLRVSGVDVVQNSVQLRCGPCRKTYRIDVSVFETYQP